MFLHSTNMVRIQQAMNFKSEFLSIVSDGMAQSHCLLPWEAGKHSWNKHLPQHLQGVIAHGRHNIVYRTFHTINKGANLQIHCLLLTLEKIFQAEGHLPDTIYYQVDGGSENTAKTVIALCELIIARRLCKKLVLSRLMVGHTHCDVDAMFGRIWKRARVSRTVHL